MQAKLTANIYFTPTVLQSFVHKIQYINLFYQFQFSKYIWSAINNKRVLDTILLGFGVSCYYVRLL